MEALEKLGIEPFSILLYLINLGSVLLVLTFLLYRPILGFMDKRRKEISDSVEEASILRDEFEKTIQKAEKEKIELEKNFREEMEKLKKFVEQKRGELTKEMEAARAEMMAKASAEIEEKKRSLLKEAEGEVLSLMKKIILNVVQNKVPENVIQESIKDAWKTYNK